MNMHWKLLLFMSSMLLVLSILMIAIGTGVINTIVYSLNTQLLSLKLEDRAKEIDMARDLLEESGVSGIGSYVQRAQESVLDEFRQASAEHEEQLFILSGIDGRVLYYPGLERDAVIEGDFIAEMLAQKSGMIRYALEGTRNFVVYRPIETWDWLIAISIPETAMFHQRAVYFTKVDLLSGIVLVGLLLYIGS